MSDLHSGSRDLLDAARSGDEPSSVDRARMRAKIALAVGAAAAATATTASIKTAIAGKAIAQGAAASAGASGVSALSVTATTGAAAGTSLGAGAAGMGLGVGIGGKLLASIALAGMIGAGTATYVAKAHAPAAESHVERAASTTRPQGDVPMAAPSPNAAMAASESIAPPVVAPVDLPHVRSTEPAPLASAPPRSTPEKSAAPASHPPMATSMANVTVPSSVEAAPSTIAIEIAILRDAHAALASGDPERALRMVEDHARRFPNGALAEERDAARVLALCALDRKDEAGALGAAFLRDHATSPQASNVRSSCAVSARSTTTVE